MGARLLRWVVVAAVIAQLLLCVVAPVQAIGEQGGTLTITTTVQLRAGTGGGTLVYKLTGPVAHQVRLAIDEGFGDSDGTIAADEGSAFTSALDGEIESANPRFQGADITAVALRTRSIAADTLGLLGPSSDTGSMELSYTMQADSIARQQELQLGDPVLAQAFFDALPGTANRTFVGTVVLDHTTVIVGAETLSAPAADDGRLLRLRAPGAEIYTYHLRYTAPNPPLDTIVYSPFDPVESSLIIGLVGAIPLVLTIKLPGTIADSAQRVRVRWVHRLAWSLAGVDLLVYSLGVSGPLVLLALGLSVIVMVLVARRVYGPAVPGGAPAAGTPSLHRRGRLGRRGAPPPRAAAPPPWEDPTADPELIAAPPRQRPPAPSSSSQSRAPSAASAEPPLVEGEWEAPAPPPSTPRATSKSIRCTRCKQVFSVTIERRPMQVVCSHCGQVGLVR